MRILLRINIRILPIATSAHPLFYKSPVFLKFFLVFMISDCQLPKFAENTHKNAQNCVKMSKTKIVCKGGVAERGYTIHPGVYYSAAGRLAMWRRRGCKFPGRRL